MRLWSLHPRYLDGRGLVTLWREALLAQAVLRGGTRGYRHHPQLLRFRVARDPVGAIGAYLAVVADEATRRGYAFDRKRIYKISRRVKLTVTRGQLDYELAHLRRKLWRRDRRAYKACSSAVRISAHPVFAVRAGTIASWEVVH